MIIRSDGRPTYFAAESATLQEKFSRGFDHLILCSGAPITTARRRGPQCRRGDGYDREAVQMLLYSWVRFVRDGKEVYDEQADRRVHPPSTSCSAKSA